MNALQTFACNLCEEGHNLLLTGQCGTGKSYLLRCALRMLLSKGKRVAVTSTTGISCLQLGKNATTLHHWSGILDGRFSEQKLKETFLTDDLFKEAVLRIRATDCLIIDEIGMASKRTFDLVELACRLARCTNRLFGGLQVIASGDFKQLPPVANYHYCDDGSYCFESDIFKDVFPHHTNLTEVMRQDEKALIKAVNELCEGELSMDTDKFLQTLSKDPTEGKITRLFGTNFQVNCENQDYLDELPGQEMRYKSHDIGNKQLLLNCPAPQMLILKVNAPVIAIRNFKGICNGTMGYVHSLSLDQPTVNFNGHFYPLMKIDFDVYDVKMEKSLATRQQFPIKLAFALTIHRCQGMTLENVVIDCSSIFSPGQLGVAVGRVRKSKNVKIIHYNAAYGKKKHPEKVYDFYKEESTKPKDDLSCCYNSFRDNDDDSDNGNSQPLVTMETDTPTQTCTSEQFTCSAINKELQPSPWNVEDFVSKNLSTSFMPEFITDDLRNSLKIHADFLYTKLSSIFSTEPKTNEEFTNFYKAVNKFLCSPEHKSSFAQFTQCRKPQKMSTKLVFWLIDNYLYDKSQAVIKRQMEVSKPVVDVPSAALKAKLRYLAGACITKISQRLKTAVNRKLNASSMKTKSQRQSLYEKYSLLDGLFVSEQDIKESTSMPCTLSEIEYKQGPSRGLRNVSDAMLMFFMDVHKTLQENLTAVDFHLHLPNIHIHARRSVLEKTELFDAWKKLFGLGDEEQLDYVISDMYELFEMVLEHFIRVSLAESIHNFKESIPKTKKQALRAKVLALGTAGPSQTKKRSKGLVSVPVEEEQEFLCGGCSKECSWEPQTVADESIACDNCNQWFHFGCVNLSGNENFLMRKKSQWKCPKCEELVPSRKGVGKKKKRQ